MLVTVHVHVMVVVDRRWQRRMTVLVGQNYALFVRALVKHNIKHQIKQ